MVESRAFTTIGVFEQVISVVQLTGDMGTKKGCVSSRDNYWVYGIR